MKGAAPPLSLPNMMPMAPAACANAVFELKVQSPRETNAIDPPANPEKSDALQPVDRAPPPAATTENTDPVRS